MKPFACDKIRNVALAGHHGSGKTTLMEAMLFTTKAIDRLGRVEDGNTAGDIDPEEIKRRLSITTAVAPVLHRETKINILDTPGTADFLGEIRGGISAAEGVLIVLDATSGIPAGAELAAELAEEFNLPLGFIINKMDREHANFGSVINSIREEIGIRAVPVLLPIGQEANFKGVIDLVAKSAQTYDKGAAKTADIPADMQDAVNRGFSELQEAAAEGEDELTEKYLEQGELSDEEVRRGLHAAFLQRRAFPVYCCSATTLTGVTSVLDAIVNVFPSPNERSAVKAKQGDEEITIKCDPSGATIAYVFKTVSDAFTGKVTHFKVLSGTVKDDAHLTNVTRSTEERLGHLFATIGKKHEPLTEVQAGDIGACAKLSVTLTGDTLADGKSNVVVTPVQLPEPNTYMAIHAKAKADEEKIGVHLHKLTDADPTLRVMRQAHLGQTVLAGMGDTHLEVAVSRLRDAAKVDLTLSIPRVDYRETITTSAKDQYRHKKQTGGAGQFGEVHLRLEPLRSEESDFEFVWEVVGGNIPTNFKGACEKGIRQGLEGGILTGCRVVDVKAAVYDGKYHPVDSKDIAFQIAAYEAFKKVASMAKPVLLEPITKLQITIPEKNMGDIMGDLNSKRGRILGSEANGHRIVISALVPQAEIFTYSRDLRSLTQGRGTFTATFDHYERVPPDIQAKAVAAHEKEREEARA